MSDLLLELFSEEIPARMQVNAAEQLKNQILSKINSELASECYAESWVTPRRVGLYISGIPTTQKESIEELRGPKISAPAQALEGFLNKNSLTKDQLEEKGEYYVAHVKKGGGKVREVIQKIIEETLTKFVWPKSMKWGENPARWVRPLHNILCLYDNTVLKIQFASLTANDNTFGHRFHAPESILIKNLEDYKTKLAAAHVVLITEERKSSILTQIEKHIAGKNIKLIQDNELLDEVAGLVEKPFVLLGTIEQKFMQLPREVMVITLKHHQRYFMLEDVSYNLAPHFIIVSNTTTEDGGKEVIHGNEKVLKARLSDASFFYELDKKDKLENLVPLLKKLTFHEKIGTAFDKLQSVLKLSTSIAEYFKVDANKLSRAITLSKADLVTNMVKEFPELQGVMGYYYAKHDGEDVAVALAIKEHYKPQGPNDYAPTEPLSAAAAVSDKLDTLNQMFAIDIKPTGSKDPFALRRAANGIIRIVGETNLSTFLEQMKTVIRDDVREFILERNVK
jgi:glycyl-tRNA synthetase beta chain